MLKLILIFFLIACSSTFASASTWYIRDGGSTPTNCTGQTNAVYPGSGTGVACAYSNPGYAQGYFCTNGGGSCSGATNQLSSSDTEYIDGDSDVNPGQQAVYQIGYGSPQMPSCTSGDNYDCTLGNLPAGTSGNPTQVIGTGTHRPMLLSVDFPYQTFNLGNNYLTLQNVEITDNQACAYNTIGASYACARYADGINMGGSNIVMNNVYVHGMSRYGVVTGTMGNFTSTNLWVIGNGFGGMTIGNGDSSSVTGTLTFNQPIIDWNGCVEAYPLTGGIENTSNYSNCTGQQQGGYGDGLAFGPSGNQNAGNWTIIGPGSISFNTQDGLDTLHGNGNGTIQIDKMRFEGNAGNQVKINAQTGILTNSLVIGDCGWWYGATQSASGAMQPNGDTCRAAGNTISYFTTAGAGTTDTFYNNTIVGTGNVVFVQNNTCDTTDVLTIKNNIINGGYDWTNDTTWNGGGSNGLTAYQYLAGTDGSGTGCSALTTAIDYNIVNQTKNSNQGCGGAHDKCGTASGFSAGTFPVGTSGGGQSTYYQGFVGISLLPISGSSAALSAGVSGLSYWNNSNDFHNVSRGTPPSMGGLELSSCSVGGTACLLSTDCCSGACTNQVCTSSTTQNLAISGHLKLSGKMNI